MNTIVLIVLILGSLMIIISLPFLKKKKSKPAQPLPDSYRSILEQQVEFYRQLNALQRKEFENRMALFLSHTRITGVNTTVDEMDTVFIAASAIIPIFGFPDWEYNNLNEVLLYPDSFNHEFDQHGQGRTILGMVGNGAYENLMILSKHELRQSFINKTGKTNTAIHEFVHLLDKTDGSVDGLPEALLPHQYARPWLELMQRQVKQILSNRSDINPYGATNPAEFLAVAAEYFFERPDLLEQKHPELFSLLSTIFRQRPVHSS